MLEIWTDRSKKDRTDNFPYYKLVFAIINMPVQIHEDFLHCTVGILYNFWSNNHFKNIIYNYVILKNQVKTEYIKKKLLYTNKNIQDM